MGTVVRFPQERVDYYKFRAGAAIILVLPVIRIERDDSLLCDETFAAMRTSFDELHASLRDPNQPRG